jgi:transcriptional regulator with XRE-family HTH domain
MGRRSPRPCPRRLAEKLSQIRDRLGLSQEQIAKELTEPDSPVYAGNISRFEQGTREPSLLVILRYAHLAGISTDLLIDDNLNLPARLPTGRK